MRQRHTCISHGSNVEQNALPSWHATMYKFVISMVLCGLGMQQCAMHNATIQQTTFFELGIYQKLKYTELFTIRPSSLNYGSISVRQTGGVRPRICFPYLRNLRPHVAFLSRIWPSTNSRVFSKKETFSFVFKKICVHTFSNCRCRGARLESRHDVIVYCNNRVCVQTPLFLVCVQTSLFSSPSVKL